MENQKDIEVLQYALAMKLEVFNKIRFGNIDVKDENNVVDETENDLIEIKNEIIEDSHVEEKIDDKEEELILQEVDSLDDKDDTVRKSNINLSNLGTSFFGRRRR
ncbi:MULTISPECIES: hypothetical protein [Flavobacterium]|uniref:Uncharacterized protein n=1 Tax=Flavobacterium jumunjinense TaxID=998845 RepID=A0ABV5GMS2_9FLAO|nr:MULTISPECIES: hypothetical protein [Flavobacterium]